MSFTQAEVENIAHLARIDLHDDFGESIAKQLGQIVEMVEQISQINTDNVLPVTHPLGEAKQRLREDKVSEANEREILMAIAPETEAGLFLVPKVIEEN